MKKESSGRVAGAREAPSGIGLGVARQFVADNYPVAILDRNKATLEVAATELQSAGGTILALETDVADQAAVNDAFARVRSELGPVAILVTSVGIEAFDPFLDHHAGTLGADHLGEPHRDVLLRSRLPFRTWWKPVGGGSSPSRRRVHSRGLLIWRTTLRRKVG